MTYRVDTPLYMFSTTLLAVFYCSMPASNTSNTLFRHYSCARNNATGADGVTLSYRRVRATSGAWAECAAWCSTRKWCVGMAVKTLASRNIKKCAILRNAQDIPFPTSCEKKSAKIEVFMSSDHYPTDSYPCHAKLEIRGLNHCLHNPSYSATNYTAALAYCKGLNGQLPVARTLQDLTTISSLTGGQEGGQEGGIWMDATWNSHNSTSGYLWSSGHSVNDVLWTAGYISRPAEFACSGLVSGMLDSVECVSAYTLHVICAVVMN